MKSGLIVDFKTEGEFPSYGNNDPRVDDIACSLVSNFMEKLRKLHTYRNSLPTQSILTITSNVVYGKKTGNTPDGRRAGRTVRPRRQPHARKGQERSRGVHALRSQAVLSTTPWTASPTPSPSFRRPWARRKGNAASSSSPCWTPTLPLQVTTLM